MNLAADSWHCSFTCAVVHTITYECSTTTLDSSCSRLFLRGVSLVFKLVFQHLGVWGGWTSMAGWKCGRCPALWLVLHGLGGAVLRGYGNLILDVLREAGGGRFERTLNRMEISVDSCMVLTAHILMHQPDAIESVHAHIPL